MKTPKTNPQTIPIKDIIIRNRHRCDLGDIVELAHSIEEVGLLHPIVIRTDATLITGARRLAACRHLGWQEIPITVIDLEEIVRGEFAENAYRKAFLPSEIYAITREMEPLEKAAAQERQKATQFGSHGGGNLPLPKRGKTRDLIARLVGISGRTFDKIKDVMEAAESDSRFLPLVSLMDQTGHVSAAYKHLQAIRAEAAAIRDPCSPRSSIQLSAAAYNEAFPQYPPLTEHNGCVSGCWITGTSWNKNRLHGQYPPTVLERMLALFPGATDILHCPSGTVLGPGLTIDRVQDAMRCPKVVADAAALPLAAASRDVILSDPPYSKKDAKIYGCRPFPLRAFMREAHRVIRPGGYLCMLHLYMPPFKKSEWKLVGTIGVVTSVSRAIRIITILQRI